MRMRGSIRIVFKTAKEERHGQIFFSLPNQASTPPRAINVMRYSANEQGYIVKYRGPIEAIKCI